MQLHLKPPLLKLMPLESLAELPAGLQLATKFHLAPAEPQKVLQPLRQGIHTAWTSPRPQPPPPL